MSITSKKINELKKNDVSDAAKTFLLRVHTKSDRYGERSGVSGGSF